MIEVADVLLMKQADVTTEMPEPEGSGDEVEPTAEGSVEEGSGDEGSGDEEDDETWRERLGGYWNNAKNKAGELLDKTVCLHIICVLISHFKFHLRFHILICNLNRSVFRTWMNVWLNSTKA